MKRENEEHISLPGNEALKRIMEKCDLKPRIETVSLIDGLGRVCAYDTASMNTLPNSLTSRLDGIAVYYHDFENGIPDTSGWERGIQYDFVNTGIGIKKDYDTVIKIEEVEIDESDNIKILKAPSTKGELTQPAGQKMRKGDVLVKSHTLLTPSHLEILAMGGIDKIDVLQKPVVAIIPTGNELVPVGKPLPLGKNVESNSIMMRTKVVLWGGQPLVYDIVPDDPKKIINTLLDALKKADIVIINGGSSKGTDDYNIKMLGEVGEVLAHEVEHGPGKHTSFTVAYGKPVIGIVGPPIGAEYTVDWYIMPLINKYLFQPTIKPQRLQVVLTKPIVSKRPFDFYVRIIVKYEDGQYKGTPVIGRDRPVIEGLIYANAHLCIPGSVDGYEAGAKVEVELRCPIELITRNGGETE
ncbi:molybdopterin molybdotransferase MoeA [Clostridium coskatii]|uniref:Molybdopterin molybdenumtransferase n=1 Tax=Clostridium coskatii TaxID=1705578 RepID=A0A166SXG4_9CLOT|nr:molybdopterin molybdotransferase MoeA [Clostridium coskatii]OAA92910.1 Molybdopterin molybdenumtransferase [Clostridium coskatii]OBR95852.1 molybdopterin molybdenumtransferase [Clostridium coskatii]